MKGGGGGEILRKGTLYTRKRSYFTDMRNAISLSFENYNIPTVHYNFIPYSEGVLVVNITYWTVAPAMHHSRQTQVLGGMSAVAHIRVRDRTPGNVGRPPLLNSNKHNIARCTLPLPLTSEILSDPHCLTIRTID